LADPARLASEWSAAAQEHVRVVETASAAARAQALELAPVLDGPRVVGVVGREREGRFTTLFLQAHARGHGLGDRCAGALDKAGATVAVFEAAGVTSWWTGRGFRRLEQHDGLTLLEPPSRRADLLPAASCCLVDALSGRVLLGRRRREPWKGRWS